MILLGFTKIRHDIIRPQALINNNTIKDLYDYSKKNFFIQNISVYTGNEHILVYFTIQFTLV